MLVTLSQPRTGAQAAEILLWCCWGAGEEVELPQSLLCPSYPLPDASRALGSTDEKGNSRSVSSLIGAGHQMGRSDIAILLVPHSIVLWRPQFSQSKCTVTLVLCRLKWLGPAQIQVPFSAMEISCQHCIAMANQIPEPKCVWRSIPSSALLRWPPKNTSYLFSHAVFCQRHLFPNLFVWLLNNLHIQF